MRGIWESWAGEKGNMMQLYKLILESLFSLYSAFCTEAGLNNMSKKDSSSTDVYVLYKVCNMTMDMLKIFNHFFKKYPMFIFHISIKQ